MLINVIFFRKYLKQNNQSYFIIYLYYYYFDKLPEILKVQSILY